mmetsp:Transcript_31673/g.51229  ORF Transcript_31673/g.51229 Transcript_31673/m.51229 type:complete len:128 (+) Transcript_31673:189-572(+)
MQKIKVDIGRIDILTIGLNILRYMLLRGDDVRRAAMDSQYRLMHIFSSLNVGVCELAEEALQEISSLSQQQQLQQQRKGGQIKKDPQLQSELLAVSLGRHKLEILQEILSRNIELLKSATATKRGEN